MSSEVIVGIPQLERALRRKAAEIAAAKRETVSSETELATAEAKRAAPVRTGALREGIVGEVTEGVGTVVSTSRHGGFVENGTYKDRAQPYMKPTAERTRRGWPARASALFKARLGG